MIEAHEILFIGNGQTAVCWYRCALPAMHMGADWVGVYMGEDTRVPPLYVTTGLVRHDTRAPNIDDYKLVIVQQPAGRKWERFIEGLQARGIKVLVEVDDYLHGVAKQKHHDFSKGYGKAQLHKHEMCMRLADGIIASTPFIAGKYRRFNKNTYVCSNGIDMARYRLTIPERPTVNIGWAGATGHVQAIVEWVNNGMMDVMVGRDNTCFVSVGQPQVAQGIGQILGQSRAIGIPFAMIETYPAAMCMFDIALAPAQTTTWYKGKSDLRWLEAGSLGLPVIATPFLYPEIEHGVTGFHAATPSEMAEILLQLVDDPDLRRGVGEQARDYIASHRDMPIAALAWMDVARTVVGDQQVVNVA